MFKKLSLEDKLQKEKEKNFHLLNKQAQLENAILELGRIISEGKENNG